VAPVATRALHPTRHMYRVQFPDGFEADVHPDEITAGGAS